MEKYKFQKYKPSWRIIFRKEKTKIAEVLGKEARIEHVGSTAIPSLGGKGIIDILVGISGDLKSNTTKLEKIGYEFRKKASTDERLFFRCDNLHDGKAIRIHIHTTKTNSEDWKEIIFFRDYLRENPRAFKEYEKLKKKAVMEARGSGKIYRKMKQKFIQSILSKRQIS